MKKPYIIALGLFAMLVCSTLTITAMSSEPSVTIRLPQEYITMCATDGIHSYFNMVLSDVPSGFDIANGTYQGWCVQKSIRMTRGVNHAVILYSSYDTSMPKGFQNGNWDKINYILNHKKGSRDSIQKAIWCYTDSENCSPDPDAAAMIADAEQNGTGFIPQSGEILAILIEGVKEIQRTFLELTLPKPGGIGDLVWYDSNADGIQDKGEPGLSNVNVRLYQSDESLVNEITTNDKGIYSFVDVMTGEYYLEFTLPAGYVFSPQDAGSDDAFDSDANTTTGRTFVFTMIPNEDNLTRDAGMYIPSSGRSRSSRNHPPTADATAGEPYTGFARAEITFDGSRSYDRDGRIISWRWSFGDGTNGSGEVVQHAYALPGRYTVILTVTDNKHATDSYTTTAAIALGNNPPSKPSVSGPASGQQNISYVYSVVSTDPDGDSLQYVFSWGDGSQSTSPLFASGHSIYTMHQWGAAGLYTVRIYAQDPSNASSEVSEMIVLIDVRYVGSLGYLINSDGTGPFDMFYSNETGKQTRVQGEQTGVYSIDTNGDGNFDYQYDMRSGVLSKYPEQLSPEYMMLLVGMGMVILLVILLFLLVKWRKKKRIFKSMTLIISK